MIATAPKRLTDALTDGALTSLIERHGDAIDMADLPWLGGILGKVRQGYPLSVEQVARVSRIRAALAKRYHRNGGHAGMSRDRDGAA